MRSHSQLAALALAAWFAPACKPGQAPPPATAAERPAERAAPGTASNLPLGKPDERCLASLDAAASTAQLRKPQGRLTLGVLAGLKDASDENVAHLRALAAELKRRGAEVLVADGDLGDTPEDQELLLGALAQAGLPVVASAGNREVRSDLDAAEEAVKKRGGQLIDLSRARVVDLGDALLVGLPGAFDRRQLRGDGTCAYGQRDLDALQAWLVKLPPAAPPLVLVAAVPPRGQDPRALDVSDGQNVGDPRLSALLQSRRVAFGVFGQVWESGGRAVDLAGRPVPPGAPSDQLYLNPGAAEHSPWPMNDGQTAAGQAALFTLIGRKASYEVVRAPPPPQAQATPAQGAKLQ